MNQDISIIVLAAGQSSRMRSDTSKVLHKLAGWSVLQHVLTQAKSVNPSSICLVISPSADDILAEGKKVIPDIRHVVQTTPSGTGDAVKAALPYVPQTGIVIVLFGDSPLIQSHILNQMIEQARDSAIVLSAMKPHEPAHYGRILTDGAEVKAIVEYKDASDEQRAISLCNAGMMAFQAQHLHRIIPHITNHNAKSEYYLTDAVKIARDNNLSCSYVLADEKDMLGINNRSELAVAEAIIQQRLRKQALEQGVGMIAPETVFLSMDTRFGYDVLIHPYVTFSRTVVIGDYNEIRSFSHLEGVSTEAYVTIGPFARLREGTQLHEGCGIGNFVEVKNSVLYKGVKAGHLSYLGDAEIGSNTNIGAGTITCNYDGKHKHKTTIGQHVFVGSDSAFIAPVRVGDYAVIAAGSVITDDVPEKSLALARGRQIVKKDYNQ